MSRPRFLVSIGLLLALAAPAGDSGSPAADPRVGSRPCLDDPVALDPGPLGEGARLGAAVADLGRGWIAVGSPGAMGGAGAAFVWRMEPGGPPKLARVIAGTHAKQAAGAVLAGVGDLDGDSLPDVAIGLPGEDRVVVYGAQPREIPGPCTGCRFGAAVAGDPGAGLADPRRGVIVVGAPESDPDEAAGPRGRVYVYGAKANSQPVELVGELPGERLGAAVALADVNGDGALDVVVAAPGYRRPGDTAARGRVRVLLGPDYLRFAPGWSYFEGESAGEEAGSAVVGLGDVDGDGADDFAVGAPAFARPGRPDIGRVYVVSGATGAPLVSLEGRSWPVARGVVGERFGTSLAALSPRPGGVAPYIAVGAPGASPGKILDAGTVYVYEERGAGQTPVGHHDGIGPGDEVGWSLARVADDGDGAVAILVGAPGAEGPPAPNAARSGQAYLVPGVPCRGFGHTR